MERHVLGLLEQFDHAVAAVELGLGGFVEFGAELGEGFKFTERRKVQTQTASDLFHGLRLSVATHTTNGDTHVNGGPNPFPEEVWFEIDLAVGDRNHVGRNVGGNFAFESLDDGQRGHGSAAEFLVELHGAFEQSAVAVEHVTRERFATRRTSHEQ